MMKDENQQFQCPTIEMKELLHHMPEQWIYGAPTKKRHPMQTAQLAHGRHR